MPDEDKLLRTADILLPPNPPPPLPLSSKGDAIAKLQMKINSGRRLVGRGGGAMRSSPLLAKAKTSTKTKAATSAGIFGPTSDDEDEELDPKTREAIGKVVIEVSCMGAAAEERMRVSHKTNPAYWFLSDKDSFAYKTFRKRLEELQPKSAKPKKVSRFSNLPSSAATPSPSLVKIEPKDIKQEPSPASSDVTSTSKWRPAKTLDLGQVKVEPRPMPPPPKVKIEPAEPEAPDAPYDPSAPTRSPSPPPVRKRKSRWGHQEEVSAPTLAKIEPPTAFAQPTPILSADVSAGTSTAGACAPLNVQREQMAMRIFGRTDLSASENKQLSEQIQMKLVESQITARQVALSALERLGGGGEMTVEEEIEEGSWEHARRAQEMAKTADAAAAATSQRDSGGHHMIHFLPPDQLAKLQAAKDGLPVDDSEYPDNKLQEDNKGFQLLAKMGWSAGAGLGSAGQGITAPVSKGRSAGDQAGLGLDSGVPDEDDDEFDDYRRRMMLAYRFRPNPLVRRIRNANEQRSPRRPILMRRAFPLTR